MDPQTTTIAEALDIRVARVNGFPLVAGLYWEKLDAVRSYMREAREKGKRLGMDIVTIRQAGAETQAGYSPKNRGAIKGMFSMATVVASIVGHDALVAFQLDEDTFGLVGVLRGLIVPGCDTIGSREDIEALYRDMTSRVAGSGESWKRMLAPLEFGVAEQAFDLAAELTAHTVRKEHRLQPLTFGLSKGEQLRYGALAAGVIVAVVGGVALKRHIERVRAEHAVQTALQAAEARARAFAHSAAQASAQAAASLPRPWANEAPLQTLLAACQARLQPLPLSIAGWVITDAHCAAGQLAASYTRGKDAAPYTDFATDVETRFGGPPAALDASFTKAAIGGRFAAPAGVDETLLPSTTQVPAFVSHFQALQQPVTLTALPPTPLPGPKGAKPAGFAPWRTYTWQITTTTPPSALLAGLDPVGVRLASLDVRLDASTATLHWTLKGDLYVAP